MPDHSLQLQKAIIDILKSNAVLMQSVSGIYDDVPENASYPFIAYRDVSATDFGVKGKDAQEFEIQIDVWSQYRGTKESKEIMAKVHEIMHNADVAVNNASFVNMRENFSTVFIDADDGITRHGVMRFRVVVFDNP